MNLKYILKQSQVNFSFGIFYLDIKQKTLIFAHYIKFYYLCSEIIELLKNGEIK